MPRSVRSSSKHKLILYPDLIWYRRKRLWIVTIGSALFAIVALWSLLAENRPDSWKAWLIFIFFGFGFLVTFLQLIWGPIFVANDQGIRIHNYPFAPRITFQWSEIATITLFKKNNLSYIGFILAPAHIETFLQRQPLFTRKALERRLRRTQIAIAIPDIFIASGLLIREVEEKCHDYIQKYHISMCKSQY